MVNLALPVGGEGAETAELLFTLSEGRTQALRYKRQLKRLLDDDPDCRGKYEFVEYKEEKLNFSEMLIRKLRTCKEEEERRERNRGDQTLITVPDRVFRRRR